MDQVSQSMETAESVVPQKASHTRLFIFLFLVLFIMAGGIWYFYPKGTTHQKPISIIDKEPRMVGDYYILPDGVYYSSSTSPGIAKIQNADPTLFVSLGGYAWAKDAHMVYAEGIPVPALDSASITVYIDPNSGNVVYLSDKQGIWTPDYNSDTQNVAKLNIPPTSFVYKGAGYAAYSGAVYYYGRIVEGADPETFVVSQVPKDQQIIASYAKDKNNVYYQGLKIEGSDPQSFVFLGWYYAKDKNRVYENGQLLDADPASFVVLNRGYSKDKNKAYGYDIDEHFLSQVDLPTLVSKDYFLEDSKTVYIDDDYQMVKATSSDPATFTTVGTCASAEKASADYYKDKNHVFVGPDVVVGADVSTFIYFGNYENHDGMSYSVAYAKDKNHVYAGCGEILKGADSLTFQDLKEGYAKDASSVWIYGKPIQNADTATFQALTDGYARDKNSVYFEGHIVDTADAASFEMVSLGSYVFGKDKNSVWIMGQLEKGIQPADCTAETLNKCFSLIFDRG